MQCVYICGAVSEEVNNLLGRSVAGNKFSLSMAKALNDVCSGNLTFISTAAVDQDLVERMGGEIWPGKKMHLAHRGKYFVLSDLKLCKSIMDLVQQIRKNHPREKLTIFLENAPFAGATACATLKKYFDITCYSITIDTPFTRNFRKTGIRGSINSWLFSCGFKALRQFDGIISFTKDVEKEIGVDLPFCSLAIGCQPEQIPEQLPQLTGHKTAVYAGTLIYYNGILELLEAFQILGTEYQLHIYGYGPLEQEVKRAAQTHENIIFHGRFAPEDTGNILAQYELLINPRLVDPSIENFTFPSKLVDYILTGKSVLSSDFKTLPSEYREFVYILEDLQPETISTGVRKVFDEPPALRQIRGQAGVRHISENQTYEKIAEKIVSFTKQEKR